MRLLPKFIHLKLINSVPFRQMSTLEHAAFDRFHFRYTSSETCEIFKAGYLHDTISIIWIKFIIIEILENMLISRLLNEVMTLPVSISKNFKPWEYIIVIIDISTTKNPLSMTESGVPDFLKVLPKFSQSIFRPIFATKSLSRDFLEGWYTQNYQVSRVFDDISESFNIFPGSLI